MQAYTHTHRHARTKAVLGEVGSDASTPDHNFTKHVSSVGELRSVATPVIATNFMNHDRNIRPSGKANRLHVVGGMSRVHRRAAVAVAVAVAVGGGGTQMLAASVLRDAAWKKVAADWHALCHGIRCERNAAQVLLQGASHAGRKAG